MWFQTKKGDLHRITAAAVFKLKKTTIKGVSNLSVVKIKDKKFFQQKKSLARWF